MSTAIVQRRRVSPDLVYSSLDDQSTSTSGNQALKHFLKVARHLLERPLDRLVLSLVEHLHKLLDRCCRVIQILASLQELIALFRKRVVLLKRFLVHVSKLFEALVHGMKLLDQLAIQSMSANLDLETRVEIANPIELFVRVLFKRFFWKHTKIANVAIALVFACCQHLLLGKVPFSVLLQFRDAPTVFRLLLLRLFQRRTQFLELRV